MVLSIDTGHQYCHARSMMKTLPLLKALLPVLSLGLLMVGCASTPSDEKSVEERAPSPKERPVPEIWTGPREPAIDYVGLANSLGLNRPKQELGYSEKTFDTCQAGYGFSASNNCRRETFVAINFQILCRDSEGTVSVAISHHELKPLSGRSVKWGMRGASETMRLDGEGYGQILRTFSRSQRTERLKLTADNDFVYVRASEAKRLVVPRNWCD